jgi:uncharacterized damage-inducible protein DinB
MSQFAIQCYRQNEWANLALLDLCRDLTDDQMDTAVPGTFGSIRDTWLHIVGAEGSYATQLGHEPGHRLGRDAPWPGFDDLEQMIRSAADALVATAGDAPDRILTVGSERRYEVEAGVIMVQVFNHGTEHRSQICTILTTLGLQPPEYSGWEWGLADDRMRPVS